MPPVMNRNEVQTPAALPSAKTPFDQPATIAAVRPAVPGERKVENVNAPVGSIAAIESRLGF
ncbi:hypothetical protein MWN33_14850 [Starkeya koreensis]|uniref:Uncharacterized protein n=1 Tax=Ancylobacter koreensis TaxID=266121 RepID=A0ABT0DQC9_9HYPH|nr:hypothetical protein [Ancylobacter koreensis]MCK0209312.1 hypothetical protein [Ancylobacter koreensis]